MIKEYLQRIGITKEITPDINSLKLVQKQHLLTVPFENLDMHIYKQININPDFLFDKIVNRNHGGICYELNFLLYTILTELNFDAVLLGAKVLGDNGSFYDHVLIKLKMENTYYLSDVGFGDNFLYPLKFIEDIEQVDAKGIFKIVTNEDNTYTLLQKGDDEFKISYIILDEVQDITAFNERMIYFTRSDESIFKKNLFCSLEYENGRISLKSDKLIETIDNKRTETKVNSMDEYLGLLKERLGIVLGEDEVVMITRY